MRKLILLSLFILSFASLQSQTLEDKSQTIFHTASEKYAKNDFRNALQGYLEGLKIIESDTTQASLYKEMARMASICYDTLDMDHENMIFLEKIMTETKLTPEEQPIFSYQYSRACLYYGTDLLFGDSSNYEEMRSIFQKGLPHSTGEIQRKLYAYIGYTYYFEGAYAEMDFRYDEAEEYLLQAQKYFEKGKDLDGILRSVNIRADIAYARFRLDKAMNLYQQVDHYAKAGGALKQRYEALKRIQRLSRELDYTDRYLTTTVTLDSLIQSFTNLDAILDGKMHIVEEAMKFEDYYRAEDLLYEVLEMTGEHPLDETGIAYQSLATSQLREVYRLQGNLDSSVIYAKKSIQNAIEHQQPRLDLRYLNLISIYTEKKDRENSFRYLDSMRACYDEQTTTELLQHYHYVKGKVHGVFTEWEMALQEFENARQIAESSGLLWDDIILELNQADIYKFMGRKEESLSHYKTYEVRSIDAYGENSLEHVLALSCLANAQGYFGELEEGWENSVKALEMIQDFLGNRTRFLPSTKKSAYFHRFSNVLLNIAAYPANTGFIPADGLSKAYDALLLVKGIQLASEKNASELILESGSEQDIDDYQKMNTIQSMLAELEGQSEKDFETIAYLYTSLMTKDAELAQRLSNYAEISSFAEIRTSTILSKMNKKDVLIDIFRYNDWKNQPQYAAYILQGKRESPLLVPLFAEERINSLIDNEKGEIFHLYADQVIGDLSRLIVDPIAPFLSKNGKNFIAPDGRMHEISFSGLKYRKNTLLGDRYRLFRLSSARQITEHQDYELQHPSILLYGGITYDMTADEMIQQAQSYDFSQTRSFRSLRFRQKNGEGFNYLPFTKTEVSEIQHLLNGSAETICLTGKEATEESFMSINGAAPHLLHFATHGFYYTEKDREKADALANYRDAMNLTGLVMAGANAAWKGEEKVGGVMDGLLTADEISRMDLRNTKLVTLSACNTGKGKVTSEGIYGLQRAFKKAGAQSLIVSLWEASDRATSLFMTSFYEELMDNGWDIHRAFTDARSAVRKVYPDPFYWAGFILID